MAKQAWPDTSLTRRSVPPRLRHVNRVALSNVGAAVLLLAPGCGGSSGGGSSATIAETKSCFESSGYTTNDRPELGFADVGADDWYDVEDSAGDAVVTVAYFEDADSVDRGKRVLRGVTKTAAEAFDIEITDDDIDELVRTSGGYLYWWTGTTAVHEDDVERCVNV